MAVLTMSFVLVLLAANFATSLASTISDFDVQPAVSLIVNGDNATQNRYPYYTSLRYTLSRSGSGKTGTFRPYCGATLIGDRLVLTAAHCVVAEDFMPYMTSAKTSDFRKLGFNFTSFPNTYVLNSSLLQLSAFVGADNWYQSGSGNTVSAWFVHPWYDPENMYYDIAVGYLSQAATQTPVKVLGASNDVYSTVQSTANFTAVGLGDVISDDYSEIMQGLNSSYQDVNSDASRPLKEVNIGTLTPRVLCGKAITAAQQRNASDGSANTKFGTLATVVSAGQMCVGEASNADIDKRMRQQAYAIAASTGKLPQAVQSDLLSRGIDFKDPNEILELLNGYNDTCQGDSGGPIVIKGSSTANDVQVGIVSYGIGCGSGVAGVYTSIQAFLNTGLFDGFLLDVLKAVPSKGTSAGSTPSNVLSSIPGAASSQSAGR